MSGELCFMVGDYWRTCGCEGTNLEETEINMKRDEELEEVNCALCGGNEYKIIGKFSHGGKHLYLVECRKCRLCYVSPRLSNERMTEYFQSYTDVFSNKAIEHWHNNKLPNIKADLDKLKSQCPTGKLLDVACGHGFFLHHARKAGYQVCGIDISQPACEYLKRRGFKVFCGQLTELALPSESFDIVTCFDMLEYVSGPLAQIIEMKRLLRPGGIIMIRVLSRITYARMWQVLASLIGESNTLDANPFFEKDHLIHYSTTMIRALLTKAGFSITEMYNARLAHWADESWVSRCYRALASLAWDVFWRLSGQKICLATSVTALARKPC